MNSENPFRSPRTPGGRNAHRSRPWLALNFFTFAGTATLLVGGNHVRTAMLNAEQLLATLAAATSIAAACLYMGVCRRKTLRLQAVRQERRARPSILRDMMNLAFCGSWRSRRNRS